MLQFFCTFCGGEIGPPGAALLFGPPEREGQVDMTPKYHVCSKCFVDIVPQTSQEDARLRRVIERDRSRVSEVIYAVRKAIIAREWLRLGRGSYEYDDDRWKDEFGKALDEIQISLEPLRQIACDLSDSPVIRSEVIRARTE